MTLLEVYNEKGNSYYRTDKNTGHSYIAEYYNSAFKDIECKNFLELGIDKGHSLKLWRDYFTEAKIYGLDIKLERSDKFLKPEERNRIEIKQIDAYSTEVDEYLNGKTFDIIVDDGPHSLQSMMFFCEHYPHYLTKNGIAVVEDIPSSKSLKYKKEWIPEMVKKLDTNLFKYRIIDLTHVKNKVDDVLMEIRRV